MAFKIVRTPEPVYVSTAEAAAYWIERLYCDDNVRKTGIGVDTETSGLDIWHDRIILFSVASDNTRLCVPVRLLPEFKPLLEDPTIEKHLSNTKYDQHLLANEGVFLRGTIYDTIDMTFLLDENEEHGLKETAYQFLGLRMETFSQVFGSAEHKSELNKVSGLLTVADVLEMYDCGETEYAEGRALDLLIDLGKVRCSADELKLLRALRKEEILTPRKAIAYASKAGMVSDVLPTGYKKSDLYLLQIAQLLNIVKPDPAGMRAFKQTIDADDDISETVRDMVEHELVERAGLPESAVEYLRTIACDYASLDAWASHALVPVLSDLLQNEEMRPDFAPAYSMLQFYKEQRIPFMQTLWNMERRGFRIDVTQINLLQAGLETELRNIEKAIVRETHDIAFNPNSPAQLLGKLFEQDKKGNWFDPFGLPPKKVGKGGVPSTDKSVLEDFAGKGNTLSSLILDLRRVRKLHDDYAVGLPTWIDHSNRIHTTLKAGGARTYRLSSASPNLQNIPAKSAEGKRIRGMFIAGNWNDCPDFCLEHLLTVVPEVDPEEEMCLVVADYSMLELCITAHFSKDPNMVQGVRDGLDLHCRTVELASQIGAAGLPKGITYQMVKDAKKKAESHGVVLTPEEEELVDARGKLKSTSFGIIYGIGALKLGMQLKLPIIRVRGRDTCPEAQDLINKYLYDIYPGVGVWISDTHSSCRDNLVVYTVAGHPRRLPNIASTERGLVAQAERQAPNSRVQGSGADICNAAMIACEGDAELRRLGVRLLMQVHDELIFECPVRNAAAAMARIKFLMEDPFPMLVPIRVSIGKGKTWGEAK